MATLPRRRGLAVVVGRPPACASSVRSRQECWTNPSYPLGTTNPDRTNRRLLPQHTIPSTIRPADSATVALPMTTATVPASPRAQPPQSHVDSRPPKSRRRARSLPSSLTSRLAVRFPLRSFIEPSSPAA
uniref:Uncharacterized protein n=1 Tax=Oryza brachyantha TaxID=4533 RepID=J3LJN1_ORYBR